MSKQELFKADLTKDIKAAIARLPSGTVGVGRDCLWQCTRITSQHGPQGVNAGWVARQVFNEIVAAKPFNRFVYEQ